MKYQAIWEITFRYSCDLADYLVRNLIICTGSSFELILSFGLDRDKDLTFQIHSVEEINELLSKYHPSDMTAVLRRDQFSLSYTVEVTQVPEIEDHFVYGDFIYEVFKNL